jgi:hypothetical protein
MMDSQLPATAPTPEYGSGPADQYAQREAWLQFVRPAADRGKLDKIPTTRPKTRRDLKTKEMQNYYLSRKSYGAFSDRYDLIDWS